MAAVFDVTDRALLPQSIVWECDGMKNLRPHPASTESESVFLTRSLRIDMQYFQSS